MIGFNIKAKIWANENAFEICKIIQNFWTGVQDEEQRLLLRALIPGSPWMQYLIYA